VDRPFEHPCCILFTAVAMAPSQIRRLSKLQDAPQFDSPREAPLGLRGGRPPTQKHSRRSAASTRSWRIAIASKQDASGDEIVVEAPGGTCRARVTSISR
jgi:N-methylhydantoinase B/oxoprolinase/acetone carboxylase alpha subunit